MTPQRLTTGMLKSSVMNPHSPDKHPAGKTPRHLTKEPLRWGFWLKPG